MRHAPCNLAPGRRLLRAQQIAGVLDDDHESGPAAAFDSGHGDCQMQRLSRSFYFQLLGGVARAAGTIHQVADLGGILAREQIFEPDGVARR